jgi:type VI protein secretion system component Hcp
MKIGLAISGVTGASDIAGHVGEVEAIGMADRVQCRDSRRDIADVTELLIWRHRDKASPVLGKACAAATNLKEVTINLFESNDDETALVVFATYVLTNTYVSRYEIDTSDANGIAYGLHRGYSVAGAPTGAEKFWKMDMTVNDSRSYARDRASVTPIYGRRYAAAGERAVERLWLSSDTIKWTYTGGISKGWNIAAGTALAAA